MEFARVIMEWMGGVVGRGQARTGLVCVQAAVQTLWCLTPAVAVAVASVGTREQRRYCVGVAIGIGVRRRRG